MSGQPARYNAPDSPEAVVHDLPPIRFDGQLIAIRLQVRRSEDGIWRGRGLFGAAATEAGRSTAEIFCPPSEPDLWEAGRGLPGHHPRDPSPAPPPPQRGVVPVAPVAAAVAAALARLLR